MSESLVVFFRARMSGQEKTWLSFDTPQMNEVSDHFVDLVAETHRLSPSSKWEGALLAWDLTEEEMRRYNKPHAVIIYFVATPERSRVKRMKNVQEFVSHSPKAGGLTARTTEGTISEVYVQDNFPTKKLAHIAFHEMLHNKLDVGQNVISDLHTHGGAGLASATTTGRAKLTGKNAQLLSPNVLKPVRQVTRFL